MNHLADELEQRAAHLNTSYEKMQAALDRLRQIDERESRIHREFIADMGAIFGDNK